MKKLAVTMIFVAVSLALYGQGKPVWMDDDFRKMKYPEGEYVTGFAYGVATGGKPLQELVRQMQTEAEADLSKKIIARISTRSESDVTAVNAGGQYRENERIAVRSVTESETELAGVATESYYDAPTGRVYAFAFAKRSDLTDFYKGKLALYVAQTEGALQTAEDLEAGGEKVKAREQCEAAALLLQQAQHARYLLTAIAPGAAPDNDRQAQTASLHNRLTQMQARLAQAVLVYVESRETNFSQPSTALTFQVKAALARKGCSFVNDPQQADFVLHIAASTRHFNTDRGFVTCYADVQINLTDTRKKISVFRDEFSQKGVTTAQDTAGRKALEDAAPVVADKISPWTGN
jgi:hypothetical protein